VNLVSVDGGAWNTLARAVLACRLKAAIITIIAIFRLDRMPIASW